MDRREVIKRILETRTSETVAHLAAELNVSICVQGWAARGARLAG